MQQKQNHEALAFQQMSVYSTSLPFSNHASLLPAARLAEYPPGDPRQTEDRPETVFSAQ